MKVDLRPVESIKVQLLEALKVAKGKFVYSREVSLLVIVQALLSLN